MLMAGYSAQEALFGCREIKRRVGALTEGVDVAVFHLIRAGQYLEDSRATSNVLEMTDALSAAYKRGLVGRNGLLQLIYNEESRRCSAAERKQIESSDATVVVTRQEADALTSHQKELVHRVHVVPLGIEVDCPVVGLQPDSNWRICFIGAMWYRPNIEACEWFSINVLPLLRRRLPGLIFDVVGHGPTRVLSRLESYDGVKTHGYVRDLHQVVSRCIAAVAPMRSGSGMQTKILESLVRGLPTMCSTLAAEPLRDRLGDVLLVCESPEDYVWQLQALISSGTNWKERSVRGRQRVCEQFVEHKIVAEMVSIIRALTPGADALRIGHR